MSTEPIAIIGSGCRFPEANSPAKLWDLLSKPRDVLREIPADRYNAAGFYHPDGLHHGSSNVRHAYTLTEDVRTFDASFFQISANEAAAIDPQQRLLLEVVYEALEAGGLPVESLRGSNTAIIVGQMCADYNDILTRDLDTLPTYFATGTSRAILANRVSYAFDWHGPSWTIDTACSSSLVAVHQAIQALRSGESRVAVAAGSNLLLGPEPYIAESKLKMLSPDGRSRMWDDRANGYARGDGVAAIVMKKLSTALEDGDTVECVIRATGVNQDGRTKGITMPSSDAQAELIRKTYKAGGLDLVKDRPQFFEAHGTGTKAGDPQEARAIFNAFFGQGHEDEHAGLTVGSIKTIIGHTEGTAGLAGLFKASLALQNARIPPNMHCRTLNPEIEPYWSRLRIPTELQQWPAHSGVRRASVNSFGFGGTNAHAILESHSNRQQRSRRPSDSVIMPFVFSAQSESALADMMERMATHLRQHPDTDLADLAWTLYMRRSLWPIRAACSGTNASDLITSLFDAADKIRTGSQSPVKPVSIGQTPRVLGVFTGQGAQWPTMGSELIRSSPWLERRVDELEEALSRLPEQDRPTWSLKEEMLSPTAKVGEARLSQPLCTAVQILLVDCLKAAGIEFSAVVGHSSGEIGAAYAAECISGEAAMWIAYYRGLHTAQAGGQKGEPGGMLAAGTSMEDAHELCELPTFAGRLAVAASNSAASVTMSGDRDAVNHAHLVFQDEKKFARPLIVDKAYHSHHMRPCAGPYGNSLEALRIQVKEPRCSWYSSVYDGNIITGAEGLDGQYWVDNMCRPVLFSQALTEAAQQADDSYHLVLEVGPHPALKGPATATIQDALKQELPYTGLLQRKSHDAKAFADAMSFIWARFGRDALKLPTLQAAFSDTEEEYQVVRDLPSYPWDHSRPFWHESRVIQDELFRDSSPHLLLGTRQASSPDYVQWRNILSLKEIPWLRGHSLQGQTVFPASGYISMAIEASRSVVGDEHRVSLIEVLDLTIDRPITFDEDDSGADVVVTLSNITRESQGDEVLTATFSCHTTAGRGSKSLIVAAHGRVCITLDTPNEDTLPSARQVFEDVIQVDGERFYDGLKELGYDYTGPFKALDNLARYLNLSIGVVYQPTSDAQEPTDLLVHPALLDASFQSVFLAYSWPGDGRLSSLHVPTSIKRVQVNPTLCASSTKKLYFHTECEGSKASISGDITLSRTANEPAAIRVEQITVIPVVPPTAADDRALFASEIWENADFNDAALVYSPSADEETMGREIIAAAKHLIHEKLTEPASKHAAGVARISGHLIALADSHQDGSTVEAAAEPDLLDSEYIDLTILTDTVNFLSQDRELTASHAQQLWEADLLSQYFQQGLGVASSNSQLSRLLSRLSHRYPEMNITELNTSNLSLTASILQDRPKFSSYTLAAPDSRIDVFKETIPSKARMSISAFDFKRKVEEQGFAANQSDLVIATLVLSDVPVDDMLKAARRLVRPGGYIFLQTVGEVARIDLYSDIADTMPLTIPEWHRQLRQHGFAGIDALYPSSTGQPLNIIVSQATDERVALLRQPLLSTPSDLDVSEFVLVGGMGMSTLRLIEDLSVHLSPKCARITRRDSLDDLANNPISALSTVICFSDLDSPVFKNLQQSSWNAFKALFEQSKNILWLLRGARSNEPYCNATVGFGRTARLEMPHLNLQFLDIGNEIEAADGRAIAEHALRLCLLGKEGQDSSASSVLWSNEPELLIGNGKTYIPRVIPHKPQNDRYNASRRLVTQSVNPSETAICLQRTVSGETAIHLDHVPLSPGNMVLMSVIYSAAQPLSLSGKSRYLVFGRCRASHRTLFALAPRLASQVAVEKELCIFQGDKDCEVSPADLILTGYLTAHLLIQSSLRAVLPNSSIVVFDADSSSRIILSGLARARRYNIIWATHTKSSNPDDVVLHRRVSDRELRASIPIRPSVVLDLSQSPKEGSVARRLSAMHDCRTTEMQRLQGIGACNLPGNGAKVLQVAYEQFRADKPSDTSTRHLVKLEELPKTLDPHAIIDWHAESVPVQLDPADAQPLFHTDKTYLLVGLTGGLGLSLCEWMVRLGARHLVVTSRSPKVDDRWIQSLRKKGATITVSASDITDPQSVQALYDGLQKTAPPIAGVVNGAMVLRDSSIYDMDVEKMRTVLRPKIDGSRYLASIFTERHPLDFFIMLSSLTGACGNSGQANYTAANMFMAGLAAQRKERGLAGSVIDIGAMMGVGVLVRDRSYALQVQLREYGYLWMSEYDFHQSFAEAILAGRPDTLENPQVLAGIRLCRRDQLNAVQWAHNPRFSHCILPTESTSSAQGQTQSTVPLATSVAEAADETEIRQIVEDAFLHKLVMALSLPELEDAQARARLLGQGVDELGVDSLVAVDIRSWWLRELHVDMPVLKIMGGTAITDLIAYAVKQLQPDGSANELLAETSKQIDDAKQVEKASEQVDGTSKQAESSEQVDAASIHSTDSYETEMISTPSDGSTPSTYSELDIKTEPPAVVQREPMSYGQRRFWFLSQYLEDRTTFNITCLIRLNGDPATEALARAVHALGTRHTALRTCFFEADGEIWQGILPETTLELENGSVRNYDEAVDQFHLMHAHEYILTMGESMRIKFLSGPAQRHYLLIGYHHINMDGISLQVVLKDIEAVYSGKTLGPEPLQYHQFSTWQYQQVERNAVQSDIEYWRNELRDMPDILPILSVSRSTRQPMLQYAHHRVDFKIPRGLGAKIKQAARKHRATSFHFYLSVFKALLYSFSGSHDVIIGVADGNRNHLSGAPDSVGFYLNLLPVRLRADGQGRFGQALEEARTQAHSALAHSQAPIDVLYNELQITRSSSYSPLFQAVVNFRQGAQESLPFGNCRLEGDKYEIGKTGYDISLDVIENAQSEATVMFVTQSYLYSAEQTEVLAASFKQLLSAFSQEPEARLDEAQPYATEDVTKALALSQGPEYVLQWKGTLVDRIDEMVARFPKRPAIQDGSLSLTYAEMSIRVHAIAALLLAQGVVPGWKVAVFQQPTIDWVCCMLAVLRIGAIYIPFDPKVSLPRLQRIAQNCEPEVVLYHSATAQDVPELLAGQPNVISIDVAGAKMNNTITNRSKPDSTMFILYTSGSTGQPKGVILLHSGFTQRIETASQMFALGPDTAMLQQSALTFDASVTQAFMALSNGGRLFLLRREYRGDPAAIVDRILEHGLTHTLATPSEYQSWLQLANSLPQQASALAASKWKVLFSGGEKMSDSLKHELRTLDKQDLRLHNLYGPTEVSIFSHSFEVDYRSVSNKPVPLGPVNMNYSAFVVDQNLKPVPVGVPGEILVTGPGIAVGYLHKEDLTREKFVQFMPPRSSSVGISDRVRGYRTGDRGRLRPDGIMDFEGRIGGDTEIKLRGLRMDLNDIECALLEVAQGRLTTAVVTVRGDETQYLIAHVVLHRKQQQLSPEEQRAFVDTLTPSLPLPQYMWPAAVIIADSLPITPHGKIDRRAIEALPYATPANATDIEVSLTEAEAQLRTLWEEVLPPAVAQLHQIGPKSDFFHVGGNSMLLVKLQQSITRAFGQKTVLVDLFERTTLAQMVAYITNGDRTQDRIDWAQETALDADPTPATQPAQRKTRQGQIILTGATGFLGQALLHQLLADPTVNTIHCIAVRSPSRLLSSIPPASISRVKVHAGDLSLPLCGLDSKTSTRIFSSADAIIHNGADVHFLKPYGAMRPANVSSTKWLAQQARTYGLPLHFISSASVIQFAPISVTSAGFPASSVAAYPPPSDTDTNTTIKAEGGGIKVGGYASSKWVSEVYLEHASQTWGIDVHIHRPTAISGPNAPTQDIFPSVVRFSREIRAVPELGGLVTGWLDFVDVERVARDVLDSVASGWSSRGDGGGHEEVLLKFHHHAGDVVLPVHEFREHLAKEIGEEIRSLELAEWIEQAVQGGMSPMVGEYLRMMGGQEEAVFLPMMVS